MKTVLVALLLAGASLAFVPAASANPCHVDDVPCMVECLLEDPCGIYDPLGQCPDGVGFVVHVNGRPVPVCLA